VSKFVNKTSGKDRVSNKSVLLEHYFAVVVSDRVSNKLIRSVLLDRYLAVVARDLYMALFPVSQIVFYSHIETIMSLADSPRLADSHWLHSSFPIIL